MSLMMIKMVMNEDYDEGDDDEFDGDSDDDERKGDMGR